MEHDTEECLEPTTRRIPVRLGLRQSDSILQYCLFNVGTCAESHENKFRKNRILTQHFAYADT